MSSSLILKTPVDPALCTLPTGMSTPVLVSTAPKEIKISWDELTDARNGGDIPIFYLVEYKIGSGAWTSLNANGSKVLDYTHTSATVFTSGATI